MIDAISRDFMRTRTSSPGVHEVARDVDRLLIDLDVTVTDELARGLAARREAHAIHDVVEPALEAARRLWPVIPGSVATRSNVLRNCCSLTP